MKVPIHVVQARRERLEKLVTAHRYLPLKEVCRRLGISEATARRDLAALQSEGRLTRTHGGALSEFNERFPSFSDRQRRSSKSKLAMAKAARKLIVEGGTYFMDSGTTVYFLAEVLAQEPSERLRILTVNLPAAEVLSGLKDVEVFLTGGQLFRRQSVLLGEAVARSIEGWTFDAAFLSAEGMDAEGLWNSQLAVVAHQHAVVRRARRNVFLLDRSKLGKRAAHFLLPWPAVDCLLSDAVPKEISSLGATITHWHPSDPPPVEKSAAPSGLPVHFL